MISLDWNHAIIEWQDGLLCILITFIVEYDLKKNLVSIYFAEMLMKNFKISVLFKRKSQMNTLPPGGKNKNYIRVLKNGSIDPPTMIEWL